MDLVPYGFGHRPRRPSCIRDRRGAPDEFGGSPSGLEHLISRRSLPGMLHTWARAGSHRFPGDPSHAFALLQDPGRAGKISPWRSCRCCPRATQAEGLNGYIISRLTQGLSIRCLRFTSDVAASRARLASGWRAAPLPGGGRTLWTASKGFRLHSVLLSRTSPVARVRVRQAAIRRPAGGAGVSRPLHSPRCHRQQPPDPARRRTSRIHLEGLPPHGKTKTMTLPADEFIRHFLLHTVPDGFHRIRHCCPASPWQRSGSARDIKGIGKVLRFKVFHAISPIAVAAVPSTEP